MAKGPPLKGEFFTGLYKSKSHPPVLVIELPHREQFNLVCDIMNEEMFIKVRRIAAQYRQLVLNTVGDAVEVDPGVLDHENCRLNMVVKVVEPNKEKQALLDNAPFWSILFVHPKKKFERKDKLSIAVHKETEEILMRCLMKAEK